VVEADPGIPLDVPVVELPGGPGRYAVAVGHTGRAEMRREAARVSGATLVASADGSLAAWRSLDGIERYLIRLWPDATVDDRPRPGAGRKGAINPAGPVERRRCDPRGPDRCRVAGLSGTGLTGTAWVGGRARVDGDRHRA
jgi:hypothetical protein